MKKHIYILLLLLITSHSTLYAQEHYIGVRGGLNGGSLISSPVLETKTNIGNSEFGIFYRREGEEKWLGGIQIEASYVKTAFSLLDKIDSDSSYNRSLSYIEVPFMWRPHYAFGKKGVFKVFLNAGVYISYILDSEYEYIDEFNRESAYNIKSQNYFFNRFLDVRLGYGLMGGAGFEVMILPNLGINAEFRYKFSFSDIWKNKAKVDPALSPPTENEKQQMFGYKVLEYSQSQLTQMGISFGISYRFGKKNKNEIINNK